MIFADGAGKWEEGSEKEVRKGVRAMGSGAEGGGRDREFGYGIFL